MLLLKEAIRGVQGKSYVLWEAAVSQWFFIGWSEVTAKTKNEVVCWQYMLLD